MLKVVWFQNVINLKVILAISYTLPRKSWDSVGCPFWPLKVDYSSPIRWGSHVWLFRFKLILKSWSSADASHYQVHNSAT